MSLHVFPSVVKQAVRHSCSPGVSYSLTKNSHCNLLLGTTFLWYEYTFSSRCVKTDPNNVTPMAEHFSVFFNSYSRVHFGCSPHPSSTCVPQPCFYGTNLNFPIGDEGAAELRTPPEHFIFFGPKKRPFWQQQSPSECSSELGPDFG